MSWISKTVSNVAPALNPIGYITTKAGLNALKGKNPLDFGAAPGPANPYGKPDLSYLADTKSLDYLKDPNMYKRLLDTSQYNFLKTPSAVAPSSNQLSSIPGQLKTFASTYKPPTGTSDLAFNDLIGKINAPSSVDQVNSDLDNQRLQQLLQGIDTDTDKSVGSIKSDFLDRGLSGPGMASDIEGNALAQAYSDANKNKSSARLDLAQKELDRLKAKEDETNAAYGTRYTTKAGEDSQAANIAAQGAQSDVNNFNSTLLDTIKSKIAAEDSAAGRTQQNNLTYANLLDSGTKAYTDTLQSGNNLFAQLLNARDLGAAGINSSNYNTGVEDKYKNAKPSYLDSILRNINLGVKV